MKILQVIPFFTPARGGSVAVPYNLSKQLAELGHEVTIITTDFELDDKYVQSLDLVRVIPFHCMTNLGLMLYSPTMKAWLNNEIRNFDIVHMHNFRNYQNIIVYHYAKKYKIPYVIQVHGSIPLFLQKKRIKMIYDMAFGNKILTNSSRCLALSEVEFNQYKAMGVHEKNIDIIPNGIDLSKYGNLPIRGEFRNKYGLSSNDIMILYLGRLHKLKGIDLLVEAFADLVKVLDNVRLVIVGPDSGFLSVLKAQIEDLKLSDVVLLTGPLYESEKLAAYVDADLYVLPSVYEAFPVTVLEAFACGVPVVVTDRCGISDIIGSNGGYVIGYNKNQLCDAITKIISDNELQKRLKECGKKLVENEFSSAYVIHKLERIYQECINQY